MPVKFWKVFAALGVPGLTLGVFYMLSRSFSWEIADLPPSTKAALALAFLGVTFVVTLVALRYWQPGPARTSSVSIGSGSHVGGSVGGRDVTNNARTRSEEPASSVATVSVGERVVVNGSIAGRDIVIEKDRLPDRAEELAGLLEDRARKIERELAGHLKYTAAAEYLGRFRALHEQHISALRQGQLIRAHEILVQIHSLSHDLESDEFWARHSKETPGVAYQLSIEAFQRGFIIKNYAGTEAMELLVARAVKAWREESVAEEDESLIKGLYSPFFRGRE